MNRRALVTLALVAVACSPAPDAKLALGTMDQARVEVARSQELQYKNVEASGSPADRCERARLVAEAWLNARNEAEHTRWKAIETTDCAAVAAAQ